MRSRLFFSFFYLAVSGTLSLMHPHIFRTSLRTLRAYSTMSSSFPTSCSPFTRAVVSSMRRLYPESLADKSFDNTGLLLEAPFNPQRKRKNSVLLTIDLTKAVADEAIACGDSVIVAYHPTIFRGLKSLTLGDPQQQSLLRLVQEGISVYSPHTAVDCVPGGMADWLCDIVTGNILPSSESASPIIEKSQSQHYSHPTYPRPQSIVSPASALPHTRNTIHPSPTPIPKGFETAGAGRLVTFSDPQSLSSVIDRIAQGVGNPAGIPVALPQSASLDTMRIRTVGVCPGSGSSVLLRGGSSIPDLVFTGELGHHDALAAIERGSAVVALSHSNTERGYLHGIMRSKLASALEEEWQAERESGLKTLEENAKQGGAGTVGNWEDAYKDETAVVDVSERDRDPFGIMIRYT